MVNLLYIRHESINCLPVKPELLATPCQLLAMHLACQLHVHEVASCLPSCLPITGHFITPANYFLPASRTQSARLAGPKITLHFPCLYVRPHIMCAIITSRSLHCCHATLLSRLQQFRRLLCVATMSSLAQLRVPDGYQEAEAT